MRRCWRFTFCRTAPAVADFSEALALRRLREYQSEQLAVDSIARTLEANVPQVLRLKILIHGQEVDTLAGHVDLTQYFVVNTKAAQPPPGSTGSFGSLDSPAKSPTAASPAPQARFPASHRSVDTLPIPLHTCAAIMNRTRSGVVSAHGHSKEAA